MTGDTKTPVLAACLRLWDMTCLSTQLLATWLFIVIVLNSAITCVPGLYVTWCGTDFGMLKLLCVMPTANNK